LAQLININSRVWSVHWLVVCSTGFVASKFVVSALTIRFGDCPTSYIKRLVVYHTYCGDEFAGLSTWFHFSEEKGFRGTWFIAVLWFITMNIRCSTLKEKKKKLLVTFQHLPDVLMCFSYL
jgi:hypothetical protein